VTYALVVRGVAERDMSRARDWYMLVAPHQVERLEARFDEVFDRVQQRPLMFAPLVAGARRAHLRVFPYEIWYLVHEDVQTVEVVALVHDRQEPTRLHGRPT